MKSDYLKKQTLLAFTTTATAISLLTGCTTGSTTTSNIDFDARHMRYDIDPNTGLCFGMIGSKTSSNQSTTNISSPCVPCSPEVLKRVNQDNLNMTKKNGLKPHIF